MGEKEVANKKQLYDLHTGNPTSQESEYIQVMISKKAGGKLPKS